MLLEGQPVRIGDGNDAAQGSTTDPAITSDSPGTEIGFLRGLVNLLAAVSESSSGRLKTTDTELRRLIEELVVLAREPRGAVDQGEPGGKPWRVDGSGVTQPVAVTTPVAVSALPAVTGTVTAIQVGTSGLAATILPYNNDIAQSVYDTDLRRLVEELVVLARDPEGPVDQGEPGSRPWRVDGSGVTQPVSLTGPVVVTSPVVVTGMVTAIQAGASGLQATILPYNNDATQAVYDTDCRHLLEEILLEIRGLREDDNEERSVAGRRVDDGWTGLR